MRKDYLPVDDAAGALDEAAFVEQHWSALWKDRQRPPDVSAVAESDEYRVVAPYLERLPAGSHLLDGGCGLGEWTLYLSGRGYQVTGLDISTETIERLKSWFPQHDFRQGDLRHTDFAAGSFDAYYSWGTFEHFESGLGDCLVEAGRLLRRGGWLFVSVPFHNRRLMKRDRAALERWDDQFDPASGYERPQRFYQWRLTREELRRELELRGFKVHEVAPIAKATGVGRWLQWEVGLKTKGTTAYRLASRVFGTVLPSDYISHMILAVAQRR